MTTPEEEQVRLQSRKLFHRIGAWGTLNALRQNLALGRAGVLSKHNGDEPLDDMTKAMLEDVPFGSVVNYTPPQTQTTGMSSAAKVSGVGLLIALAGAGGYMLAGREQAPPPPVDAVLEWEVNDAGGAIRRPGAGDSRAGAGNLEGEAEGLGRSNE